ncbi:MAG: metallophosphoesterase [Desulfurobacteriaceae bacterium]
MRIAVASDSHDNLTAVSKLVEALKEENVELLIHCGDFVSPFTLKKLLSEIPCDFTGVFGNNDGELLGLSTVSGGLVEKPPVLKTIDGKRFVLMHEPLFVDSLAKSGDFDYVIYGHTHRIDLRVINGCRIINPGELCGYLSGKSTFVILDTHQNTVEVRVLK